MFKFLISSKNGGNDERYLDDIINLYIGWSFVEVKWDLENFDWIILRVIE